LFLTLLQLLAGHRRQVVLLVIRDLLLYAFAVMSRRQAFQLDHDWQRTLPRVT
jgi:hypothetical protein